mmetsp:Transcript_107311/g.185158  ORF Transcript_107311/g.185158 Transcript_107311/m.185158 type:complete len:244 (-) Transcript_107311:641-1372(-)
MPSKDKKDKKKSKGDIEVTPKPVKEPPKIDTAKLELLTGQVRTWTTRHQEVAAKAAKVTEAFEAAEAECAAKLSLLEALQEEFSDLLQTIKPYTSPEEDGEDWSTEDIQDMLKSRWNSKNGIDAGLEEVAPYVPAQTCQTVAQLWRQTQKEKEELDALKSRADGIGERKKLLTKVLDTVDYAEMGSQQRLAKFEAEIQTAILEAERDTPTAPAAEAPAVPDVAPEGGADESEEDPYRPAVAAL